MGAIPCLTVGGERIALAAADGYRLLRAKGATPRGIVDLLIASYCIAEGIELLHNDRDFDPMERLWD